MRYTVTINPGSLAFAKLPRVPKVALYDGYPKWTFKNAASVSQPTLQDKRDPDQLILTAGATALKPGWKRRTPQLPR
jgi:hypothetical protein